MPRYRKPSYQGRKWPGFYSKQYVKYRSHFGPAGPRISERLKYRLKNKADRARYQVAARHKPVEKRKCWGCNSRRICTCRQ